MSEENVVIAYEHGGGAYVGPEAVDLFRARMLASSLRLYAKTGTIPTRGANLKFMLGMACQYTGKRYRVSKAQAMLAAEDVKAWADALALALPHEVR